MPDIEYTEQDLRDAEARRVATVAHSAAPVTAATRKRNEIVRALLDQKGWSMTRVAKVLNVSRAYVNKIDKGKR